MFYRQLLPAKFYATNITSGAGIVGNINLGKLNPDGLNLKLSDLKLNEGEKRELGYLISLLDERVDEFLDRFRGHPTFDRIFYTASQLGDHALIWQIIATIKALLGDTKQERNLTRLSTSLALESILVNGILKSLFPRERPETSDEDRPHYLRQPITSSFPSGHASSAVLSSILLMASKKSSPLTRTLIWTLAGIISTSRVYVKIHHASDVIAGAAVGWGLGKFIKSVWRIK